MGSRDITRGNEEAEGEDYGRSERVIQDLVKGYVKAVYDRHLRMYRRLPKQRSFFFLL